MRNILLVILFTIIAVSSSHAQAIGRIYVKGDVLKVNDGGRDYIYFNPFKSNLSDSAKQYLNYFGKLYKDSVGYADKFTLKLEPASSAKEQKTRRDIGVRRVDAINGYLKNKFRIKIFKSTLIEQRVPQ